MALHVHGCIAGKRRFGFFLFVAGMICAVLLVSAAIPASRADAHDYGLLEEDLTELNIEDLMEVEVSSVARKTQKISDTAAAIFVITQEDIRRSGVTNIPDALRMVPGIQVARINSSQWAVSSRGFNARFSNKLLVLIDGRTVYTPLFSGVFWDSQDTMLEDIDRIEVIRGPGATMWGANAVNGVINIITRHARDTVGGLVTAGAGSMERGFGVVRYGLKLNNDTYFRVYSKYFDRGESRLSSGGDANDNWHGGRTGVRLDTDLSRRDSLTAQGDIYYGRNHQTLRLSSLTPPFAEVGEDVTPIFGGHVLTRWKRIFSGTADMALQFYYNHDDFHNKTLDDDRDTYDLDFQNRFAWGERQQIVWGAGFRHTRDEFGERFTTFATPPKRNDCLYSFFLQDDITLVRDRLRLTVGSKFEHNDYTGFEVQPNARLLWTPTRQSTFWADVARAVRTPSRAEADARINQPVIPPTPPETRPFVYSMLGNHNFESEELIAYEAGYRMQAADTISFDLAAFYNIYHNLRTLEQGALDPETDRITIPLVVSNKLDARAYGAELAVDWRPLDWWRIQGAYTWLKILLKKKDNSNDTFGLRASGDIPLNQVSLRSSTDLPGKVGLDFWLRYVDSLPIQGVASYLTIDARLAWKPVKDLELSLVGQNLLDSPHTEFLPEFVNTIQTQVERSVYGKITWLF